MCSVWYLVNGLWCIFYEIRLRCMVCTVPFTVRSLQSMQSAGCGIRTVLRALWCERCSECGPWFVDCGVLYVLCGLWDVVCGM